MKKLLCAVLIATLALSAVGCKRVGNDEIQDTNPETTDEEMRENETLPPQDEQTSPDNMYVDGVYRAEMDDATAEVANGYKDYVEVTVEEGRVSDIVFDSQNTEGMMRSEDPNYTMETPLKDWMDNLRMDLMDNKDYNTLDGMNDDTPESANYRKLVSVALENAKKGNKEVAVVNVDEMNNM